MKSSIIFSSGKLKFPNDPLGGGLNISNPASKSASENACRARIHEVSEYERAY
jgi:hypothetical protein